MKKCLIVSLIALVASPVFAAATAKQFVSTSATGNTTTITSASDCTLLSADVKVNTSAANVGSYGCDTGTSSIGVAIANTNGKRKVYSASSAGGGIVAADIAGTSAITTGDTDGPAVAAAASS